MEKTKIGNIFEVKVAIVTASTQGIDFSIAERLGLEGASVVVSSRKQKNVDEAVEKLKAKGIEVIGILSVHILTQGDFWWVVGCK
ncbi:hypothetical protein Q3G72_007089 [Acer saccharum]|nr:hypothetical protein Q3G72_007089 [Acer saccharum]